MSERSYSRIDQIWRDNHHVTIIYPDGSQLCRLPVLYLEKSGTNDWKLVQDIVQALITEPIAVFEENGSELQDMSGIPVSGQYTVRHRDPTSRSEELTPKLGPEGNTRYYPLDDTARSSKSGSSRSTSRQNNFRLALNSRDAKCVVTGHPWMSCIASHIVPFSRLDVYQRIYIPGISENNLFEPCMGVLLDDAFSRMFDRFNWSIYWRQGRYYFHGPAMDPDYDEYHGKKLKIGGKEIWHPRLMPLPELCQWHWEQCMMAHARGFAVWPTMEALSQEQQPSVHQSISTIQRRGKTATNRRTSARGSSVKQTRKRVKG